MSLKLKKSIQIFDLHIKNHGDRMSPDLKDAHILAANGLHAIVNARKGDGEAVYGVLPGEERVLFKRIPR